MLRFALRLVIYMNVESRTGPITLQDDMVSFTEIALLEH
jgi:hypothetical protein